MRQQIGIVEFHRYYFAAHVVCDLRFRFQQIAFGVCNRNLAFSPQRSLACLRSEVKFRASRVTHLF